MLKVVASEKFYHFVCTLRPPVLLGITDAVDAVAAVAVVVLLHVVIRNRTQTEQKPSIHYAQ